MNTVLRLLLAAAMFGASVALTAILLQHAIRVEAASDAALVANFNGSAYEDIFGVGFWPTWAILTIVQMAAVAIGWRAAGRRWLRFAFPALLVAFAIASALDYRSFEREHSLWEMQGR